jgi:tellurite resistance protein
LGKLGVVIPEILQPPHSGKRNLDVFIRMVDMDNLPDITHGFSEPDHPGVLWVQKLSFNYDFTEKGYEEETEHRDEAMGITAKIGIAVAMADGSLDDREGKVINAWVVRNIEPYSDEKKKHLKKVYNDAMKEAFTAAKNGDLSLSTLTSRLNEISEKSARYETIELCFDVMAADGVADAEELKTIRKIAEALDLDLDEIEKMRDQKIIGFNTDSSGQASIEDLLGIETHWDKDQIKKHLRTEFQKWNNRLNTLSEGRERENAQRMLDLIADARRNYA